MKIFKFIAYSITYITLSFSCSPNELSNKRFTILATNDIHGRFFDSLYNDSKTNSTSISKVSSILTSIKDTSKVRPILIDLGDHLQGDNSVYYYNFIDTTSQHVFSKIVKYLDYDAVVIGNHDIEAGHPVYDRLAKELKVPYIAANAININTQRPYFKPYKIVKRAGVKIGILGMTNPNIKSWLSNNLWSGIEFEEVTKNLNYWIEYLKEKKKVDFLILATHTGIGEESYSLENPSLYIAKNFSQINVVLAAHDHKTYNIKSIHKDNRETILIESGNRGSALSKVDVIIEKNRNSTRNIIMSSANIPSENYKSDKKFNDRFNKEYKDVKSFSNKIIGSIGLEISSRDAFIGSSDYMSLIHKIQLESSGADISFAAPLSFDVLIKKGDLTYQDLMNIYPFENQLYIIELTGEEIRNYLEFSYSKWIRSEISDTNTILNLGSASGKYFFKERYYNFDSASGIIYEVDLTKAAGKRVRIISMNNNSKFDLQSRYKVAISSYRASGGGDLLLFGAGLDEEEREKRVIQRLGDIRDLIYQYLKREKAIIPSNENNWKFIPETMEKKIREEYKILFPKS